MKQFIKIIAAVMCIAILGVTLCSCKTLENQKNTRAVYCDDSKECFTFRGYTYKQIKLPSYYTLLFAAITEMSYAVSSEIPLLLTDTYGDQLTYNSGETNPIVISCIQINNKYSVSKKTSWSFEDDSSSERCYVREDKYVEVKNLADNAELNNYSVYKTEDFSVYNEDDFTAYTSPYKQELVSDEMTKAIKDSLNTEKKIKYSTLSLDGWNTLDVIPCDKNMMLTNNYSVVIFTDHQNYYLFQTKNGESIGDDLTIVPEKYKDLFNQFFTEYKNTVYEGTLLDYFVTYPER